MTFVDLIKSLVRKREQHRAVDLDLEPVLLVPGIGGSILNAVHENGSKERVWVRLFGADAEFRSKLYSKFDPDTGKTVSLNRNVRIQVPQDRHGLYSCDILDPDVLIRFNSVYYFHDLIDKMLTWGYLEGTSLFGFGYDFRQSNRLPEVMDALKEKILAMHEISGGKKVKIVSHSMGGLLVKCFLALNEEFFQKHIDTWIAIAAPFQGAPGFVTDCLLTGVEFVKGWQKELFVAKWSTHQLLIECPSLYELMASPEFEWCHPPQLQVWKKLANENGESWGELHTVGPDRSVDLMWEALKENVLNFNGENIPCPFNHAILQWSNRTREIMKSATIPEGVKFYNIFGTSFETPLDVCYGSEENPLEKLTDILHTEAGFTCVNGDGTVPAESAKADRLHATGRLGIPGDHRGILMEGRLFRVLKHWLEAGEPDPFYDPYNDFVILPTSAESEELKKHHKKSHGARVHPEQQHREQEEYIAAIVSDGTRAEAHARVEDRGGEDGDCIQVSVYAVAEGPDAQHRGRALEEVMATASQTAISAADRA